MTPLTLAEITALAYAYALGAKVYLDHHAHRPFPVVICLSLAVGGPISVALFSLLLLAATLLFDLA